MNIDSMTSLRLLRGLTIEEMLLQEYPSAGYVTVLLKSTTKKTFAIRSTEVVGAPFEAYTLSCSVFDGKIDADGGESFPWRSVRPKMLIDDVTIVEREEWIADGTTPGSPVLASNQTFIDAGPRGSAPSDAVKVIVSSGIALRAMRHGETILLYLNDFPGVLGVSTDQTEIDDFIRRFTEVRIAAQLG